METKCAPSYAVIFMGKLENFYPRPDLTSCMVVIYRRHIHDLALYTTGFELLPSCHKLIPRNHKIHLRGKRHISQFPSGHSTQRQQGKLHTSLYTKPTDSHLYLHYSSFHPKHQKQSLPYSQALRLRRICSDARSYNKAAQNMYKDFIH